MVPSAKTPSSAISRYLHLSLLPISFLLFIYVFIQTAWISQDAFITYRVLDNAVNGYGLRWNISERVQAYTHPLWLFIHLPFYAITQEAFYTSIIISAICTLATIYLITKHFNQRPFTASLIILFLTCSRAFMDYTTSGLENPLSHLLITIFFLETIKPKSSLTKLTLLASLAALTRLDNILILFPVLVYQTYQHLKSYPPLTAPIRPYLPLLILISWHLFSLIYYGTPFPNTAYAKLNIPFSQTQILTQGLLYIFHSLLDDPITLITTVIAITSSIFTKNNKYRLLSLGIITYLAYTIWIGGDFMSGRFLSTTFLLSILILSQTYSHLKTTLPKFLIPSGTYLKLAAIITPLALSFLSYQSPILNNASYHNPEFKYLIADERGYYYPGQGLLTAASQIGHPTYKYTADLPTFSENTPVMITANIGSFGFNAGPHVHIIDELTLTDPLLARLPPNLNQSFRPGHLRRDIPPGYIESIETNTNLIQEPQTAALYDQIKLITQGPLFTRQRWQAIYQLNKPVLP